MKKRVDLEVWVNAQLLSKKYLSRAILLERVIVLLFRRQYNLTKKEGYKHSKASFGFPSYTGSISLQLLYVDYDLCDPNSISTFRGYPVKNDGWFHQKPLGSRGPFILLVNDGGMCPYVQKVRHAQHVGASGVLIAPISSDT